MDDEFELVPPPLDEIAELRAMVIRLRVEIVKLVEWNQVLQRRLQDRADEIKALYARILKTDVPHLHRQ